MAEIAKVKTWLEVINEVHLYDAFLAHKIDTISACSNLSEKDLDALNVTGPAERKNLILNSQLLRSQPDYYIKLKAEAEKRAAAKGGQIGKKGTQRFLTMARADLAAYNYLSSQYEARQWIEQSIDDKLDDDFWVATADGTALCRLANKIWPGCINRFHPADSYKYKLLDNIGFFLKVASERLKVSVDILFSPIDLFEKKNMPKVVKALQLISEHATKNGFAVPWRSEQDLEFTPKQIQDAKKLEGLNEKQRPAAPAPSPSKAQVETTAPPAKSFISQAEEQKRAEAQQKKSQDQDKASRTLRLRQKEQEELLAALRREEEEERKRKEEAELRQKKELEELERARQMKQKEVEQELIKQRQEEERKRLEAEEKAEAERAVKYGGKSNLQVIRTVIDALRNKLSNEDGDTMLHLAVRSGNAEVVRYVVEELGANVNKPNFNQDTALHQAAKLGNESVVAVLLKSGANVNVLNRDGDYALHHAAIAGHTGVVQLLVKAGAEIDARNLRLETPLILAVRHSNLDVVDALIKAGADVNAFSKDEETCLHMAAKKGNVDLINKLNNSFNFKLDLNPRNRENATPLQVAAEDQYLNAVKRLVELGADLHTKRNDGWDPLYTAAYNGDLKTAVFLLSKGADINGVDEEGWSPLHAACAQGHLDIVKSFMEDFNAKANVINENGTTPLFHAVSAGRRTIAQYLLDKGADINLSGPHAWKPIHAATYNEFKKLTELLTERGANLSSQCRDIKNYSPLHILISTDKPPAELVELLIKKKAPLDIQHESGGTPLHLAAFWGHEAVTKLLLDAGAKTDIKNDKGRTALDIAALYGHRGVAEMIAKKSGQPLPKLKEKKKKTTSMKAPAEPPNPDKKN